MKKISMIAVAAALMSGAAVAGQMMHNNNVKSAPSVMMVEDIEMLNDDSRIVAQGYLVQNMGNDIYVFQDAMGDKIMVDIDDDAWGEVMVGPNDMVMIMGELDKNGNDIQIDVDTIKKM
ncbi:MAG: NirD/YgiW/YdeI family stress tolerance protein [Proteobacteria bacterium]|nr:NirD/YgiW/YdeI family stress tolerance protein [Candidatus Enterousia scatequi]